MATKREKLVVQAEALGLDVEGLSISHMQDAIAAMSASTEGAGEDPPASAAADTEVPPPDNQKALAKAAREKDRQAAQEKLAKEKAAWVLEEARKKPKLVKPSEATHKTLTACKASGAYYKQNRPIKLTDQKEIDHLLKLGAIEAL